MRPMEKTPQVAVRLANGHRLQWEAAQQCHVLLYPEGMVQLNDSAAQILKLCDGTRSADSVAAELNRQYPGEDLSADVRDFLEVAHARGWVA